MSDIGQIEEDNISDIDSSFDFEEDNPTHMLPELEHAYDEGNVNDGGIPIMLEMFQEYPLTYDINEIIDTLISSGFSITFVNRIYAILKNIANIYDWMLKGIQNSPFNSKILDDPLNNYTTFNKGEEHIKLCRGIWRWLHFTENNEFELVLAVPPRHWAFGKNIDELNIPGCVSCLSSGQFHEKYNSDNIMRPPIAYYWWFIVIHPAELHTMYYNTFLDIINAIETTNMDISIIKSKNVMTVKQLKNIIIKYSDLINECHKAAIGYTFKDRLHSRPNKRTRERRKHKLLKYGYSI